MFDKFGEFGSVEELNMAAEGFLKERDIDSLKKLAKENGIEQMDVEDYIAGNCEKLATLSMAAYGRLDVFQKEVIDKKESIVEKMMLTVILSMTKGMASDVEMQTAIMHKGKNLEKVLTTMRRAAEKHKNGNMGVSCGTDRQLCEIIRAYYLEDDSELTKKLDALYK